MARASATSAPARGCPAWSLAIARPDLRVTLVEPLLRRTTFLEEAVRELELGAQVEVLRGRAEELHGKRTFDVVTSRAVAPLGRLLTWSMPLVAPTGALVAMKGSSIHDEIEEAADTLRALACASPQVLTVGAGNELSTATVVRVSWADPAGVGWRPSATSPKKARRRRGR